MPVPEQHTPEDLRRILPGWFADRFGADSVELTEIDVPKQGYSNETILLELDVTTGGGTEHASLVLRTQPNRHVVFWKADIRLQFDAMRAIRPHGVPVADCRWFEGDPAVLGGPFLVMDRLHGRTPLDVPSYNAEGWMVDLAPGERRRLWDNGIEQLRAIHSVDCREGFEFLAERARGRVGLDGILDHAQEWYEWALKGRPHPTIDPAFAWLRANRPAVEPPTGVSWGDARIGNMMFDDDLSVVAVTDWEMVGLGPAEVDLGWWLYLDEFCGPAIGFHRLEGLPGRDQTLSVYESLLGRTLDDMLWYEVLAGIRYSLAMVRMGDVLVEFGIMPDTSFCYVSPITQILADLLGLDAPSVPP